MPLPLKLIPKKLPLTDFLRGFDVGPPSLDICNLTTTDFTFHLNDFYDIINSHLGEFVIEGVIYEQLMASKSNLYFYSLQEDNIQKQFLIVFDPIIDIKQKSEGEFVIFCYPEQTIHLSLRTIDEQKSYQRVKS